MYGCFLHLEGTPRLWYTCAAPLFHRHSTAFEDKFGAALLVRNLGDPKMGRPGPAFWINLVHFSRTTEPWYAIVEDSGSESFYYLSVPVIMNSDLGSLP